MLGQECTFVCEKAQRKKSQPTWKIRFSIGVFSVSAIPTAEISPANRVLYCFGLNTGKNRSKLLLSFLSFRFCSRDAVGV